MAADASGKSNLLWGLFAAAIGGFIVAGASGLFGFDLHPTRGTPQWVGIGAGALFLAGGMAIVLQSLAAAKIGPDGGLAPDTPFWLQLASLALALFIVGDFVAIFGRVAFGFGAALGVAIFLAFLIDGARRLLRRGQA